MSDLFSDPVYRITNWEEVYDPPEAQAVAKLTWVRFPNNWDSLEFRRMAKHEKRSVLFSSFVLIVQIASRLHYRGWLIRDGKGLTTEEMSLMTDFPQQDFDTALHYFKEVGWVSEGRIIRTLDELPASSNDFFAASEEILNIQQIYPKRSWMMNTLKAIGSSIKREMESSGSDQPAVEKRIRKAVQDYVEFTSGWSPNDRRFKIPKGEVFFDEDLWKHPDAWQPKKKKTTKPKPADTQL